MNRKKLSILVDLEDRVEPKIEPIREGFRRLKEDLSRLVIPPLGAGPLVQAKVAVINFGHNVKQTADFLKSSLPQAMKVAIAGIGVLKEHVDRANVGFVNFTEKIKNAIFSLKGLIASLAAGAGIAKLIEVRSQFESFQAQLETITGSAKEAQDDLAWLKDFSFKTPFEMAEGVGAYVKLKSYGLDAKNALLTLGNTAAAMTKPLDSAVEALADATTGEFERLKEFGVRAKAEGDKVAFSYMDASGKMKQVVTQNSADMIQQTLLAIFNEKYQGGMDKFAATWQGVWSNFKDTMTKVWLDFTGGDFMARLKGMVKGITAEIDRIRNTSGFKEFAAAFQSVILGLVAGIKNLLTTTSGVLGKIMPILSAIGSWLMEHKAVILYIISVVAAFLLKGVILSALSGILGAVKAVMVAMSTGAAIWIAIAVAIMAVLVVVLAIKQHFQELKAVVGEWVQAAKTAFDAFKTYMQSLWEYIITLIGNRISIIFGAVIAFIKQGIGNAVKFLIDTVNNLYDYLAKSAFGKKMLDMLGIGKIAMPSWVTDLTNAMSDFETKKTQLEKEIADKKDQLTAAGNVLKTAATDLLVKTGEVFTTVGAAIVDTVNDAMAGIKNAISGDSGSGTGSGNEGDATGSGMGESHGLGGHGQGQGDSGGDEMSYLSGQNYYKPTGFLDPLVLALNGIRASFSNLLAKSELFSTKTDENGNTTQVLDLASALGNLGGTIMDLLGSIPGVSELLNPFTTIAKELVATLSPIISSLLQPFVSLLKYLGNVIGTMLIPIFEMFRPILDSVMAVLIALLNAFVLPFVDVLKVFLSVALPLINALLQIFMPILIPILNMLGGLFKMLCGVLIWMYNSVLVPIINALIASYTFLKNIFLEIYNFVIVPIYNVIGKILTGIVNAFIGMGNFIIAIINSVLGWAGVHIKALTYLAFQEASAVAVNWNEDNSIKPVDTQAFTQTSASEVSGYGSSSTANTGSTYQSSKPRDITQYITVGFQLGNREQFRQFIQMIKDELRFAEGTTA